MTRLPFNRLMLSTAMISALALAGGCGVEDADTKHASTVSYGANVGGPGCNILDTITGTCALITASPDYFVPGVHPRFNPAASDLPLNTDILFAEAATFDGTAKVSGTGTVQDALNDIDGWSTNAYFDIAFAGGGIDETSIDASIVSPTANVFLLPLETSPGGDALNPADLLLPPDGSPFDPAKIAATAFTAEAKTLYDGTSVLRIKPTAPLLAKKKYLVLLTNGILDTNGQPITRSAAYDLLGADTPLANALLEPVRDAVQGWDALATSFLGNRFSVDPASTKPMIALTYTFTTTDPVTPLVGMGGPRAALFAASGNSPGALAGINAADAAGLLSSPKARTVSFPTPSGTNSFDLNTFSGALAASRAKLYTGAVSLPYYLSEGSSSDFSFLTKFWTGDDTLASALSLPLPADSDGSYNVTYRYPFAKRTGDVTVPLQTTLPTSPACTGLYPTQGFPVAIYVHGITSDRSSVIALAHALAGACIATVAIDLPVHGLAPNNALWHYLSVDRADGSTVAIDNPTANERHFEVGQDAYGQPEPMNFAGSAHRSGAWFINLSTLANSRDNLRQAVMDLLNLNASLAAIDSDQNGKPDFDTSKVSVVGVSLGGMVATVFTTVNQAVLANEAQVNAATGGAFPSRINPVRALTASAAGGQLTRILENSKAFGPTILAGLRKNGARPGSEEYEKFMYTTQTMIDSGDPVNFATTLRALGVPVLVQEIVGGSNLGDGTYPADTVVPNNVNAPVTQTYFIPSPTNYITDTAPLAGTDPLVALLGITESIPDPTVLDMTAVGGVVSRLTIGNHTSLLTTAGTPSAGNTLATGELQTEVVTFFDSVAGGNLSGAGGAAFGTAGANAASNYMSILVRTPPSI